MANNVDIFNRSIGKVAGAFSADDAILTFNGVRGLASDIPLLVQNLSVAYQQPVTMLFDMSSNDVVWTRGRATGQGSIGQIYGPAKLQNTFLELYGDVCRVDQNLIEFTISGNCRTTGSAAANANFLASNKLACHYVVISNLGISGTAQDMLFSQNIGYMFKALGTVK
jgi:hypothetical protein